MAYRFLVFSGWYLCVGEAQSEFELRITTRISKLQMSFDRELPGGDLAQVSLRVRRKNRLVVVSTSFVSRFYPVVRHASVCAFNT